MTAHPLILPKPETATALPADALWPLPDWIAAHADDPAYGWARAAWLRASRVPGAWFDAAKAEAVVKAWPVWFKLTTAQFAGVPFNLLDWQAIVVRLLVGWKKPTEIVDPLTNAPSVVHVRLFRRLLMWVPRKNGKSEFLAALALLFWEKERLHGSEGYCFARDEDQARIPFGRMKAMLQQDKGLTGGATPPVTMTAKAIVDLRNGSFFHLLSGKADGKHGRMPKVILGDEMHEWASTDLSDFLRQGSGTLLQPIELYGSTAGLKSNLVGYGLWEESCLVAEDQHDDPSTLAVIFAAHADADWQSPETWRAANPTIGRTPTWDYLRTEAAKARGKPTAEAAFRRYHLNQWVEQLARWLPRDRWDACAPDPQGWRTMRERNRGRPCLLALDMAERRDLTSLCYLFPPDDPSGIWQAAWRYWLPEATVAEREIRDRRLPWRSWVQSGALEISPGEVIDQNIMRAAVLEAAGEFDLLSGLGCDPWNTQKLRTDLEDDGFDPAMIRSLRFGTMTLGEPSKLLEELVFAGRFDHGGHPLTRWQAGHVAVRFDENMNFVPAKKRSAEKIDGIVAAVMALALHVAGSDRPSVYEERGLLRV